MSARDEQRAAEYLEGQYDNQCVLCDAIFTGRKYDRTCPRCLSRRHPRTLAWGLVIGFALFGLLLARCSAGTIRITLSGTLEQWINKEVYGPIAEPTPFRITLYISSDAVDQDYVYLGHSDSRLGIYVSDHLPIIFEFGEFRSVQFGAMVKVYSGYGGLFGFIFQNASPFAAFGVYHPAEWSYYAFYLQPFSASVAPTDALHWVVDTQHDRFHTYNMHAYMDGFKWWRHAWQQVHGEADNDITVYSAGIL